MAKIAPDLYVQPAFLSDSTFGDDSAEIIAIRGRTAAANARVDA
jgi:hypothetical protein